LCISLLNGQQVQEVKKKQKAEPAVMDPQVVQGNIFLDTEKVEILALSKEAEQEYRIVDFWGKEVEKGKAAVKDGVAHITPPAKGRGYFTLWLKNATGEREMTFAVVAPVDRSHLADSPYGMCSHFGRGESPEAIPLYVRAGVVQVRDTFGWPPSEKEKGVYNFDRFDRYMPQLKEAGIKAIATFCIANKLYDDKEKGCDFWGTQAGREAYGNYYAAMIKHYGDQLAAVELWNEYNGTWGPKVPKTDPTMSESDHRAKIYAEMLKVATPIIREANPNMPILGCAAVVMPQPYFEAVFKNGGMPLMDAVVGHPYIPYPENIWREMSEVRELIKKYNNGQERPVYITEYGWGPNFGGIGTNTPEDCARYLVRASLIMSAQGVKRMHWFQFEDDMGDKTFDGMCLVHTPVDRRGKWAPAPFYPAYASMQGMLGGAKYVEREAVGPYTETWVLHYRNWDGQDIRACWNSGEKGGKLAVAADGPLAQVDMMGNQTTVTPIHGKVQIAVDGSPVYLKGAIKSVSEVPPAEIILANARTDFSDQQGKGGWSYGYYQRANEPLPDAIEPNDMQPLTVAVSMWGYEWQRKEQIKTPPTLEESVIRQGLMHPKKNTWACQRWLSTIDADATLRGAFGYTFRPKKPSDGIEVAIYVDGKAVFKKSLMAAKGLDKPEYFGAPFDIPVKLKKGSIVDFVVSPGPANDDTNDRSAMIASICVPNPAAKK
jgi:hypothetical protein